MEKRRVRRELKVTRMAHDAQGEGQTQKDTQCVCPFIGNVQNTQIHRDGK